MKLEGVHSAGNESCLSLYVQAAGVSGNADAAHDAQGAVSTAEAEESDDDDAGGVDSGSDADGDDEGASASMCI